MRFKIFLDPERPKVDYADVKKIVDSVKVPGSAAEGTVGLVVGGDGVFGKFGRIESEPLLFVGVKSKRPTGSKAYLAATYLDELAGALARIAAGEYRVAKFRRLRVHKNGRPIGDVFTDVYLERGDESGCIRYHLEAKGNDTSIAESAIGDGVVVTTRAGSTGYYSYLDKLRNGDSLDVGCHTLIGEDQVGIAHIMPTYTEREPSGEHPLRYTVPWGTTVELRILRPADARLYGAGPKKEGIRIGMKDRVLIYPSEDSTSVIRLDQPAPGS